MAKELKYSYSHFPPAEKAFKCLVGRLHLQVREEDMGGGLRAYNEDRSFIMQLQTRVTERGGMTVEVHIRVPKDELISDVVACFGEPERERKMAPTAKDFAKVILVTEMKEDAEAFVADVCAQMDITADQFGNYRAMVITTAGLPGASKEIKDAAKKLKTL
ncbi:MAG: hypothetical protein ACFFCH_05920 [Promethearchaeota archaeon]